MRYSLLLSCSLTIGLLTSLSQERGWRGIVPLHSSQADMEQILGVRGNCKNNSCIFNLKTENVWVLFSSGSSCSPGADVNWMVPLGTVITFTVYFKTDRTLTEFGVSREGFLKESDNELPGLHYYTNANEGIRITAGTKFVRSISYYPTKDDASLQCPKPNGSPTRAEEKRCSEAD